jgi:hypothetical protein
MASVHEQWSLAVTSIYYHGRKKQPGLTEVLDQAGLPFTPWPLEKCVGVLSEAREPLVLGALRMAIADIVRNRGHLGDAKSSTSNWRSWSRNTATWRAWMPPR